MATKTEKYELRKKEENDFYNIEDFNDNMDKLETALTEFDDSGSADGITSFTEMLTKLVTGNKLAVTLRNLKAGLQFVLHTGSIVNNCVTDNPKLPLSAAQGKALMDYFNQLDSDLISVKVFTINVTTNSTKDSMSNSYIGTYKLIDSPSYPKEENILAVIPYGARSKLDAGRSAMVAYRTDDTFISVNSPNQPNEVFVVNVAVFYSFSNS